MTWCAPVATARSSITALHARTCASSSARCARCFAPTIQKDEMFRLIAAFADGDIEILSELSHLGFQERPAPAAELVLPERVYAAQSCAEGGLIDFVEEKPAAGEIVAQ